MKPSGRTNRTDAIVCPASLAGPPRANRSYAYGYPCIILQHTDNWVAVLHCTLSLSLFLSVCVCVASVFRAYYYIRTYILCGLYNQAVVTIYIVFSYNTRPKSGPRKVTKYFSVNQSYWIICESSGTALIAFSKPYYERILLYVLLLCIMYIMIWLLWLYCRVFSPVQPNTLSVHTRTCSLHHATIEVSSNTRVIRSPSTTENSNVIRISR